MAKSKGKRKVIGLVSKETGHRIYTVKNMQNTTDKLVLRKYDPMLRKTVEYTETKKNLGKNVVKGRK